MVAHPYDERRCPDPTPSRIFSHKFIFTTFELTTVDLLRKVAGPSPKLTEPEIQTPEEVKLVPDGSDRDTF